MSKEITCLVKKIIYLEAENKRLKNKVKQKSKGKKEDNHVGFKKYD